MSDDSSSHDPLLPRTEHGLLKPFEGTFRATVKLWMGPGDPIVQHGTMVNAFQVSGLYLSQDYVGDPSSGPWPAFVGKGFRGYNTTTKLYEGFWIDNASTMMQLETGSVDESGKNWTMQSTFLHPHSGQNIAKRTLIRVIDNDHNDMTTWMIGADGSEFRSMEILFERVKS